MKTRVVNVRHEPYDVAVHRPSRWGNPFSHKEGTLALYRVSTRKEAIERYEAWLLNQPDLMARLSELQGKVLGCFCHPHPCHAHILARLADEGPPQRAQQTLW